MRPMLSSRQTRTGSAHVTESDRKVIRLGSRGAALRPYLAPVRCGTMGDSPVAGLERYERRCEGEDDYRHRMLANLLAAIVVVVLIITGDWIVQTIAQTSPDIRNNVRTMQSTSAP